MSSFTDLFNRVGQLNEAKVSPYASAHPSFGGITKQMRAGGLSSAPLDTIKFIRETLYNMDIIGDEELNAIKRGAGFSGKKSALLKVLQDKQELINSRADEITKKVEETLDDFIGGVGVNRSREEKYAAQAAAIEIAKEMQKAKSGKELDDAFADIISDEKLILAASLAKVLGEIRTNLGDPGFEDIEETALDQVQEYADKIDTVQKLKSFISQIANEPGYEKIAAYLSSIVKPVESGTEDNEMEDQEEIGVEEFYPEDQDPNQPLEDEVAEEDAEIDDTYKAITNEVAKLYNRYVVNNEKLTADDINAVILKPELKRHPAMQKATAKEYPSFEHPETKAVLNLRSMVNSIKSKWSQNLPQQDEEETVTESYTNQYLTEQASKDSRNKKTVHQGQSFKDRYKPKTHWQLEELRRYGL